jgi:hypothetical protein
MSLLLLCAPQHMTLRCNEIFLCWRLQIVILERAWVQWMLCSAWRAEKPHATKELARSLAGVVTS